MTVTQLRSRSAGPFAPPAARHRRRPVLDLCLAAVSGVVVAVDVAWGVARYPALGGDEGIYTEQSWAILHGHLTPYTYTYDHPFIGWLQIALPAMLAQRLHAGGALSVVNDRVVMVGYAFATAMLVFGIARRLGLRRPLAVAAVAAMGLSPLFVVEARQVLLDNIALPWVLLSLFLVLSPRQRQWSYGLAGLALAVGVLSKETVLLFLPAIGYALWRRCYPPLRSMAVTLFAGMFILSASFHLLFALLRGELFPGGRHVSLWTNELLYQLHDRAGSGALWAGGSARSELLAQWTSYDRWLLYAGCAAALACLALPEQRVLGLAVVFWSLPILKPGGYLPQMYVIGGLPFAGLAIAGLADAGYSWLDRRTAAGIGRPRLRRWVRSLVAAAAAGAVAVPMAVSYGTHTGAVQRTDLVSADEAAVAYVDAHVARRARVLTDDAFWVDLARAGFATDGWNGPISYYRFDLDPITSARRLPQGWQDIDYVLSTFAMRSLGPGYPRTRATYAHARLVATFGYGEYRIDLFRVRRTPYNAAGLAPPPASPPVSG